MEARFEPGHRYRFDNGQRSILCATRKDSLFIFPNGEVEVIRFMSGRGEFIVLGSELVFAIDISTTI